MHGHQAIVFLQLHISTVYGEVHHSKHKTTPFLFEASWPGGRVRAHTLRLRKFRSLCSCSAGARVLAHVNVHVHGLVYTHAVNVHVYVCAQLHNLFFLWGFAPNGKK